MKQQGIVELDPENRIFEVLWCEDSTFDQTMPGKSALWWKSQVWTYDDHWRSNWIVTDFADVRVPENMV